MSTSVEVVRSTSSLVWITQVPMAIQDIRRGKALAAAMKQVSVVDADGNAVDLAALEAELNEGFADAE